MEMTMSKSHAPPPLARTNGGTADRKNCRLVGLVECFAYWNCWKGEGGSEGEEEEVQNVEYKQRRTKQNATEQKTKQTQQAKQQRTSA